MKLSELVNKFDLMDKMDNVSSGGSLTKDQANIFRSVMSMYQNGGIAVLNASSGTGKSVLIRALKKYCDKNQIPCDVTASTGKASSSLDGQTIHSYMGLKMVPNDNATNKDNALKLQTDFQDMDKPEILIIDESSMIGQKLFETIKSAHFNYVLFVLDSEQLPAVKEKAVDWGSVTSEQYKLTKTLRAKDPSIMKLFSDFRDYKTGMNESLNLSDYVNGDNIVSIDWEDVDYIPANSESCSVAYRNKLVEMLVDKVSTPNHNTYNLNNGVKVTAMKTVGEVQSSGYFKREFKEEVAFYNGEDVQIDLLRKEKEIIKRDGFVMHNNRKISMNRNKTGLMISQDVTKPLKLYEGLETDEDKFWISFPVGEVLSHTTLACINNEHYVLLWDNSEEELNIVLDKLFMKLTPHLKLERAIKKYIAKGDDSDFGVLPSEAVQKHLELSKDKFKDWWYNSDYTADRKLAWKNFLSAKGVCSARKSVSRTIHKAQGISVPCVVITDQSFYGASLSSQYVAVTRAKYGIILVNNCPTDWRDNEVAI